MWPAFAIACLVRFTYIGLYPQPETLCPDCTVYDRVAVNLVEGRGFVGGTGEASSGFGGARDRPEVGIGPVYAGFLAAIYWSAGHHTTPVRIVQAVLGALIVPLMWRLMAAGFGPAAARTCAWLVALSPPLVAYTSVVLTENLSVLLLVSSAWLLLVAIERHTVGWFALAGLVLGVLILLREEMLLLLPVWPVVARWKGRPRPAWSHAGAYVLAAIVCVGLWTARNYTVFGKPILVTAHGGETLWLSAKGWSEWHFDDPQLREMIKGLSDLQRDEVLRQSGWRMIAAAPGQYLLACVGRVPELWISSHTTYVRGLGERYETYFQRGAYGRLAVKIAWLVTNVALLGLAIAGIVTAFRTRASLAVVWVMAAPPALITVVHFFLFSTPRYQIPALPFMLGFAAVTLTELVES